MVRYSSKKHGKRLGAVNSKHRVYKKSTLGGTLTTGYTSGRKAATLRKKTVRKTAPRKSVKKASPRKSVRKAPARKMRTPVRRKVAGKKPVCRKHKVCITVGAKKVRAILNCKGKVQLTKGGRKTFNVLKRNCKCKKHTAYGVKRPRADGRTCKAKRRAVWSRPAKRKYANVK